MKNFSIIVAATSGSLGIGRNGDLPFRIQEDMAFFKRVTTSAPPSKSNAVIMGRKTWESIPQQFRPFADRINVVLSRNPNIREELSLPESVIVAATLEAAVEILSSPTYDNILNEIFVIGGGAVYEVAIQSKMCSKVYLTEVMTAIPDIDTFFPVLPATHYQLVSRSKLHESKKHTYRFTLYERISEDAEFGSDVFSVAFDIAPPIPSPSIVRQSQESPATVTASGTGSAEGSPSAPTSTINKAPSAGNEEEMQYLNIVKDILANGVTRGDRTGTGTLSKFGVQMRFSLRDNMFPLLTTKKVFWRGVAEELVWFVRGCTNGQLLSDKGIHIWDGNGSREFLDGRGLAHREVGDLGPVYGFQWRHFGAEYKDMHADYTGQGVDQLIDCINKLKTTPEDRRIIMSAWNPADLDKMALPPCHMFCQFYVANGELSCQMYQRSADMGLGVPFNIASYSLLTVMMAQVCGLKAGEFVHTIGDAHVYLNHVDALKEQLVREPRPFPKLFLNPEVKDIDQFEYADFTIDGYNPCATIKMKMAV